MGKQPKSSFRAWSHGNPCLANLTKEQQNRVLPNVITGSGGKPYQAYFPAHPIVQFQHLLRSPRECTSGCTSHCQPIGQSPNLSDCTCCSELSKSPHSLSLPQLSTTIFATSPCSKGKFAISSTTQCPSTPAPFWKEAFALAAS